MNVDVNCHLPSYSTDSNSWHESKPDDGCTDLDSVLVAFVQDVRLLKDDCCFWVICYDVCDQQLETEIVFDIALNDLDYLKNVFFV